jgi:hypothetical protein
MSAGKIGCLVLYAVLVMLAITQAGTSVATLAVWVLLVLAVAHAIEVLIFFRLCQRAPGSLLGNLLQLFIFGYFHMVEMKAQA